MGWGKRRERDTEKGVGGEDVAALQTDREGIKILQDFLSPSLPPSLSLSEGGLRNTHPLPEKLGQ